MDEFWAVLAALAAVVLPIALAGWLLGRPSRPDRHGKMPREEER